MSTVELGHNTTRLDLLIVELKDGCVLKFSQTLQDWNNGRGGMYVNQKHLNRNYTMLKVFKGKREGEEGGGFMNHYLTLVWICVMYGLV